MPDSLDTPNDLDIDDPDEVIAAHRVHTGAMASFTGHVSATSRAFVLQSSPSSAFDYRSVEVRDRIIELCGNACAAKNRHIDSMYQQAVETTEALRSADLGGGAQVSESI